MFSRWASTCVAVLVLVAATCAHAQNGQPRPLAPGVLKVIQPVLNARDSFSMPMALPGLDAPEYQPNYAAKNDTLFGQTRSIVLFRNVWQLEFGFTGLRQAKLAMTDSDGKEKTSNIWYMVYRIRNVGKSLSFEDVKEDPRFEHVNKELQKDAALQDADFIKKIMLRFSLEGWVVDENGNYNRVAYADKIRPSILRQIRNLEDPNQPLLDTLQMSASKLPLATNAEDGAVWGCAIWENVDPRVDYVSVFVSGLTNAYRIDNSADSAAALKKRTKKRTLQLNFWRPGDSVAQDQDDVNFGIPLVDDPKEQVEICRRYDLPGPLIRGYIVSEKADQNVLVMEVDGEFSLDTFESKVVQQLEDEEMPAAISKAMADAGVSIPNDVQLITNVQSRKWSFNTPQGTFILQVEPQYWEPKGKGIRFIRSLDYLWFYR